MMRFVKQITRFPVRNFDTIIGAGVISGRKKHGPLLPDSIRCIITGPSNCGKTNVLFNLIFDPNGLRFENIYVFSKSLAQPKYGLLKRALPKEVGYFEFDDNTSVLAPNEAKPNSLIIFDDISCEKHDKIRDYFAMGRHFKVDSFYLGQTYSKIPKQLVRDNANLLVIFKQDDMNLRHIFNDHVTTDMTFERFKELGGKAWRDKHGFIVIDKESQIDKGRYRLSFDQYAVGV